MFVPRSDGEIHAVHSVGKDDVAGKDRRVDRDPSSGARYIWSSELGLQAKALDLRLKVRGPRS